jgi:hypothetical protein
LLDTPDSALMTELAHDAVPTIYVSAMPAELIESGGQPELESIAGTRLRAVTNSVSDILYRRRRPALLCAAVRTVVPQPLA